MLPAQSALPLHAEPIAHPTHCPPQSIPVSYPFFWPSEHVGGVPESNEKCSYNIFV